MRLIVAHCIGWTTRIQAEQICCPEELIGLSAPPISLNYIRPREIQHRKRESSSEDIRKPANFVWQKCTEYHSILTAFGFCLYIHRMYNILCTYYSDFLPAFLCIRSSISTSTRLSRHGKVPTSISLQRRDVRNFTYFIFAKAYTSMTCTPVFHRNQN